jgi:DNA-binding HxlR family transcriptional regulator
MARRHREGGPPLWLDIARQPGVIEVLTALHDSGGPLSFHQIRERTACPAGVAVRAIRRLGACGLLHRGCPGSGSWDHPQPSTRFELTARGHGYAQTISDLGRWAAHHRLAGTRTVHHVT